MERKYFLEWITRKGDTYFRHSSMFNTREEYLDALARITKDEATVRISCDGMRSLRNWPFCDI